MDDKDRTILRMLRDDARASLKAIGARVGLARSSVRERIRKLEAARVIRGYRADIATQELPGGVRAIVQLRLRVTPDRAAIARIVAMKAVRRCYSLSGDTDVIVEIEGETIERLNAARDTIAALGSVADATTALILKVEKE